jgi:hypothetical protein
MDYEHSFFKLIILIVLDRVEPFYVVQQQNS